MNYQKNLHFDFDIVEEVVQHGVQKDDWAFLLESSF